MRFDGYIRVSSRKGREGENFISPKVQRATIERLAAAKGVELGEVISEMDVSGGTKIADRGLGLLVERVERGESAGVIVWKLSRFSRNLQDAVDAATRITNAGGRLIAEDFDSAQPMHKALLGLMSGLNEEELDTRRAQFSEARRRSIERGVPAGRVAFGYAKDRADGGRPKIVKRDAAKVLDVFERRAAGESFSQIARRHDFSHSTVRQMIGNHAYIGRAKHGAFVNESAYPPIVSRELFASANAARTTQPAAIGDTTRDRLLVGIAVCAGCGHTLKVVRRKRADGTFAVAYYCKDAASEPCPDRAFVRADVLDAFVETWFRGALETAPRLIDVVAAGRDLETAQSALVEAEGELDAFVENASALDTARFQRGLSSRQERVDRARQGVLQHSAHLTRIPGGGALSDLWEGFDPLERRHALAGFVDRVSVARGASADLARNVQIVWSDGTVAQDEVSARAAAA